MAGIAALSYSDALFALALEEGHLEEIKEQLCLINAQIQENQAFVSFMKHPKVHKSEKRTALDQIFGAQAEHTLCNFLKLISDKGRFHELPLMTKEFVKQYRAYHHIAAAQVTSARPLSEGEVKAVQDMLEAKLNQQVELHLSVDASLLAGIRIKINDVVLDHTALKQMEQLKQLAKKTDQHKESECERE